MQGQIDWHVSGGVRRIDHPCAEARRISSSIERTLPACYVCPRHGTKFRVDSCNNDNLQINQGKYFHPSTILVRCFSSRLCSQAKYYDTSKNGVTSIITIQLLIVFKAKTIYKRHSNNHHNNFFDNFSYIPQLYNNKDLSKTTGCTITKTYRV